MLIHPPLCVKIWSTYEEEAEQEAQIDPNGAALATEYLDVVVSSVRDTSPFSFSVQILKPECELTADSRQVSS